MAKRRKGRAVSGWLAIDKPSGIGSSDVVNRIARLFDAAKVGHGGTLDPMASGVLPIALGEATKTMAYALDATKGYQFTVQWGVETDSLDADGAVVARSAVVPDADAIRAQLPCSTGPITQVPPRVSALKVDGKRAHERARAGEVFTLAPRDTRVLALELLDHDPARGQSRLAVTAVKGFYVRALARDLAQALGTCAHLVALRRVRSGPFVLNDCVGLEILADAGHTDARDAHLMPVERVLADIPALDMDTRAAQQLRNGQPVWVLRRSLLDKVLGRLAQGDVERSDLGAAGRDVLVTCSGQPVGLARFQGGKIKPLRLFNL